MVSLTWNILPSVVKSAKYTPSASTCVAAVSKVSASFDVSSAPVSAALVAASFAGSVAVCLPPQEAIVSVVSISAIITVSLFICLSSLCLYHSDPVNHPLPSLSADRRDFLRSSVSNSNKKLRRGAKYITQTDRCRSHQSPCFVQPMPRGPESAQCGSLVLRQAGLPADRSDARCRLPGLPVAHRHALSNYGDEIVQESHLLPFSPDTCSLTRMRPTPSA